MKKVRRLMGMRIGSDSAVLQRFAPYLLYGLITLLITILYLDNHRVFASWELAIEDTMMALGQTPDPPGNVVLVNIDDNAVAKLGPWPWDSERLGYLVGMLGEYEPTAIGLDLELPADLMDDPVGNQFLARMIEQAGKVVLPLQFTLAPDITATEGAPDCVTRSSLLVIDEARQLHELPYLSASRVARPFEEACQAAWGTGHVNSWQDVDGRLRRDPLVVDLAGEYYPSMSLQLVRAALGVHRPQVKINPGRGITLPGWYVPTDPGGLMMVDYRGPAGTIPSVSAARILEGEADPATIAGKIVVVGVNATGYGTMLRTGAVGEMSRTEKIATVTANILEGRYITKVSLSSFLDILILFAIGAFCALVLPRVTLLNRIIVLLMMGLLFVNLNYVLYNSFKLITKTLFPTLEIVLFLAFAYAIKPRDESARTEAVTGSHAIDKRPRPAATGPHAGRSLRTGTHSGSTPVGPDGVPVRHVTDQAPAGVISGLAKTMVLDLNTIQGAGFAASAPATTSTPPPPMESPAPPAPAHPIGSDEYSDAGMVDMPPPVDISLAETMEAALPQGDTPQPRDLMDETPRPMGLSQEDSTGSIRRRDGDIKQLGRYEILGVLGQGAMGTVYKGRDPAIDRLVALKTIRADSSSNPQHAAELRERLVREAKAAGKLSHPRIVTIYDVGTHDDLDYIAMEYLEGYTLEQMTRKNVQVNFRITAKMLIQVCEALDYAHTAGIVHRDIKPANIMVLDNFEVKVTDFGIARVDSPQTSMTQTGIAVGTPQYIAPELLRGEAIDRRCDIFSLGVVAYELLTRRRPFTGENISQLVYAITQKDPVPPSRVDPQIPGLFDVIVGKALAKNPRERYQSAREMGQALSSFVEDLAGAKSFRI